MLENSFVHLPGIGLETEQRFWDAGVRTWDDLAAQLPTLFSAGRARKLAAALDESKAARATREYDYFQQRMKGTELWRLLPLFINSGLQDEIAFLDIETTGLGFPPQCRSTTVAVLFGGELHLEFEPQRKRDLMQKLDREARMLVTFNGSSFDLPFLRREFQVQLAQLHVDLRYWLARLGFRGGLKSIQQHFHEVRQRESMDIDGFDAVRLWKLHQQGVARALETLLTYNAEDTVVLQQLVFCALNLEAEKRPGLKLATYKIPAARSIPTSVCPQVYRQLRGTNRDL